MDFNINFGKLFGKEQANIDKSSEISRLEEQISLFDTELSDIGREEVDLNTQEQSASDNLTNISNSVEVAQNNVNSANEALTIANGKLAEANSQLAAAMNLPIEIIENEDGSISYDSTNRDKAIAKATQVIAQAQAEVDRAQAELEKAEQELKEKIEEQEKIEEELDTIEQNLEDINNKENNINIDKKNAESELTELEREQEAALQMPTATEDEPILYDEQGRIISQRFDIPDNERLPGASSSYTINYTYDENGNNDKRYKIVDGKVCEITELSYNENRRATEIRIYNDSRELKEQILNNYDENNNLISSDTNFIDNYDNIWQTVHDVYDENENIIEEIIYNSQKDIMFHSLYSYDENNSISSQTHIYYREDGKKSNTKCVNYDEFGHEISRIETYYDETGEVVFEFQYEKGVDGNWEEVYIPDYNQEINYTKQGPIGDCWLLSGINSLSYSEEGRQILQDAVTYNEDGSVSVYFKGIDTTITIEEEEVKYARESMNYSRGDNDMLVIELAFEAALDKLQNGEIEIEGAHSNLSVDREEKDQKTSIEGGFFEDVIFMLTGNDSTMYQKPEDIEGILNVIENKDYNSVSTVNFTEGIYSGETVKDIYGNDIYTIPNEDGHAFAIKSVEDNIVTIVNPWDSSIEYQVSREDIIKYGQIEFYEFPQTETDEQGRIISEIYSNHENHYTYNDETGNIAAFESTSYDWDGNITISSKEYYDNNNKITYSEEVQYYPDGNLFSNSTSSYIYNEEGFITEQILSAIIYNSDGSIMNRREITYQYNEEDIVSSVHIVTYDEKGNIISESVIP